MFMLMMMFLLLTFFEMAWSFTRFPMHDMDDRLNVIHSSREANHIAKISRLIGQPLASRMKSWQIVLLFSSLDGKNEK